MKFIKTIKEYLNEQQIFEEIKISEYRIEKRNNRYFGYFKANDLKYSVQVYHDDNKHDFGVWEVEFSVVNQKHSGDRTKKDIQHLNTVLYTVFEIVQEVVKENNIKQIYIDSANDENDDNRFNTLRGDVYYRFLIKKYGAECVDKQGRFINIYLNKSSDETKLNKIINILIAISDEYFDSDDLNRCISGIDDTNFNIETDCILNRKVGGIYFKIDINTNENIYDLSYEILDDGESESIEFKSFEKLINHLEKIKNKLI